MASKSYGWDVRNIAKISPKMVKKRAIFRLQKEKDLSRLLYRTCGSGFIRYKLISVRQLNAKSEGGPSKDT